MSILFYTRGVNYLLRNKRAIRTIIVRMCKEKGYEVGTVNYILCSKRIIKKTNIQYLNHHYYTDIITFPLSDDSNIVTADIFVCIPVVLENAIRYSTSAYNEVIRVLFHGILHMIGYDDHSVEEQQAMRNAEDYWLSQFSLLLVKGYKRNTRIGTKGV